MSGHCKRATEQEWHRPKKESDVTQDQIKFAHALNSTAEKNFSRPNIQRQCCAWGIPALVNRPILPPGMASRWSCARRLARLLGKDAPVAAGGLEPLDLAVKVLIA